jgi:ATP-dependent Clp protease protease subunit
MADAVTPQQPQAPKRAHGYVIGMIDQQATQRIANALMVAKNNGIDEIHMMFQSAGGIVGDGICIYNMFRSAPLGIILYNAGTVASIGVLAYLGADERKVSKNGAFMIHRSSYSGTAVTLNRIQAVANSLLLDDQRTEDILRTHITLPEDKWDVHKVADLWLSADEATTAGLADDISDFTPPAGEQLFYLGPT